MKEFKECGNGFEQLIQYANGEVKPKTVPCSLIITARGDGGSYYLDIAMKSNYDLVAPSNIYLEATADEGDYYSAKYTVRNMTKGANIIFYGNDSEGTVDIWRYLVKIPAGTIIDVDGVKGKTTEDIQLTKYGIIWYTDYELKIDLELEPIE